MAKFRNKMIARSKSVDLSHNAALQMIRHQLGVV